MLNPNYTRPMSENFMVTILLPKSWRDQETKRTLAVRLYAIACNWWSKQAERRALAEARHHLGRRLADDAGLVLRGRVEQADWDALPPPATLLLGKRACC